MDQQLDQNKNLKAVTASSGKHRKVSLKGKYLCQIKLQGKIFQMVATAGKYLLEVKHSPMSPGIRSLDVVEEENTFSN